MSASASEILAAAMQDYKRAIIMGTPTFGKGTVQNQINLDEVVGPMAQQFGPLGSMLITIQKFYRINGGATQLKGVTPDIVLPDPFSEIGMGEREEDYAMPWTKVSPAPYTTWSEAPKLGKVVQTETGAVVSDPDYKIIKEQALELKKQRNETLVSLNFVQYKKQEKVIEEKGKKYSDLAKKETGLKIRTLLSDDNDAKGDTAKLSRSKNWVQDLSKDVNLKEAVNTISLINTSK